MLYKGLKANPLHSMKMRFVINLRIYLWHKLRNDSDRFNLLQTLRDRAYNHTDCRICAVGCAIARGTRCCFGIPLGKEGQCHSLSSQYENDGALSTWLSLCLLKNQYNHQGVRWITLFFSMSILFLCKWIGINWCTLSFPTDLLSRIGTACYWMGEQMWLSPPRQE